MNRCSLLILFLALPKVAAPCTCFLGTPLCSAFWASKAVFVGKAVAVRPHSIEAFRVEQAIFLAPGLVAEFEVLEAFRGVAAKKVTVTTALGGADCGFSFQVGSDYIVFAAGEPLKTSICSRTSPLNKLSGDLAALRELANAPLGARLFGTVSTFGPNGNQSYGSQLALKGIQVTVTGPKVRTVRTNGKGQYELPSLPGGTYTIAAAVPEGLEAKSQLVTIPEQGCVQADFYAWPKSKIQVHTPQR